MDRRQYLIEREIGRNKGEKTGWRGRVNAKCIECIFDETGGGGTWRQQVEACTCYDCPLYEIRPITIQYKGKYDE